MTSLTFLYIDVATTHYSIIFEHKEENAVKFARFIISLVKLGSLLSIIRDSDVFIPYSLQCVIRKLHNSYKTVPSDTN